MTTQLATPAEPSALERTVADAKKLSFWAENAAPVGLVVLVVVFAILSPNFLTVGNIQAMLLASAILIILGVAQSFVITTGGIDLSISATMTFSAIGFGLAWDADFGFWLSALAALVAGGVIGVVNGLLVTKGKVTDFQRAVDAARPSRSVCTSSPSSSTNAADRPTDPHTSSTHATAGMDGPAGGGDAPLAGCGVDARDALFDDGHVVSFDA